MNGGLLCTSISAASQAATASISIYFHLIVLVHTAIEVRATGNSSRGPGTGRSVPTIYLALLAMQAVHRLSMPIRVEPVSNRAHTADCSLWFWRAMATMLAIAIAPASPSVRPGCGAGLRSVQGVFHQSIHRFRVL